MSSLVLVVELALATVLFLAAAQKFLEFSGWRMARRDIADSLPNVVWMMVPFLETSIGLALSVGARPWAGVSATALFTAFSIVLFSAYRRGVRTDCNCFGAILPAKVGPIAIGRGITLAALALGTVVAGSSSEGMRPLAVSVPLTAAAVATLYTAILPFASQKGERRTNRQMETGDLVAARISGERR